MSIDLGRYDTRDAAESGIEMTIVAPDGTELKGFRVRGQDSAVYRERIDSWRRRYLTRAQHGVVGSTAELEVESAAALIIGWPAGCFALDGHPFEYSAENAAAFVRRFAWAREQIERAGYDRANFMRASSSDS